MRLWKLLGLAGLAGVAAGGVVVGVSALIIIMGIYPQPFLSRMKPAVDVTLHRILGSQAAPVATNHGTSGEIKTDGR